MLTDELTTKTRGRGVLEGLRVIEIGHFIAAPFCTRVLADLGADVIKIEPPVSGDPVRQWGAQVAGRSAWWSVHGRNKRCVTLDLKTPEGRDLALELVARSDAVVENFRPGQLAKLGLSDDALLAARPSLVIVHISGYGQSGPGRDRAAFGVIGEAVGGLRYLTDHPPGISDLPPVRVGVSIGNSVTGLYAALGLLAAVWSRERRPGGATTVDAALADSVLSLLEGALPEYGSLGFVRRPSGGGLPTAAPTNAYRCADNSWILIAANSDPLFRKLCTLMQRPHLATDRRFEGNQQRCKYAVELDAEIGSWTRKHDGATLERILADADVPATRIFTIADCAADAQFRHRGMVTDVDDPAIGPTLHPGVVPYIPEQPGEIRWTGPSVGAHNREVFGGLLGMSEAELSRLSQKGVC